MLCHCDHSSVLRPGEQCPYEIFCPKEVGGVGQRAVNNAGIHVKRFVSRCDSAGVTCWVGMRVSISVFLFCSGEIVEPGLISKLQSYCACVLQL